MSYETILYGVDDRVARITLNRPETLNTIVPPMPDEVEAAVTAAVRDEVVKVIVLRGAGPGTTEVSGGSAPNVAVDVSTPLSVIVSTCARSCEYQSSFLSAAGIAGILNV